MIKSCGPGPAPAVAQSLGLENYYTNETAKRAHETFTFPTTRSSRPAVIHASMNMQCLSDGMTLEFNLVLNQSVRLYGQFPKLNKQRGPCIQFALHCEVSFSISA